MGLLYGDNITKNMRFVALYVMCQKGEDYGVQFTLTGKYNQLQQLISTSYQLNISENIFSVL